MRFYIAKKKTPEVPIISLLDILAILLIYTVVAFQVKTDEGQGSASSNGAGGKGNDREQAALKVDTPSTDTLATKTVREERLQILMAEDGQIAFQGSVIDRDTLVTYLTGQVESDPTTKFEIKADKGVTLEDWVFMLEALKEANIPASDVPWLIKDKAKENK